MSTMRIPSIGVAVGFLLAVSSSASPSPASAAWVSGTQFQVAGQLTQIVPTAVGTSFVDPTCGPQGGTSLALVPGAKLAGVDPVLHPVVLVVTCLDNGSTAALRARLNFINPADGKVVKQISTTTVPSNGWAHIIQRLDKGDLLGCGNDGTLYRVDYSKSTSTVDGTATLLPQVATSCKGLAWDAERDVIYQGLSVSGGSKIGRVVSFKDGTTTLLGDFTNLPCPANGLAVTGGVLLMSCEGELTIRRLDKNTGASLGVHGTLTATGLTPISNEPGLGDLACDPVTFHKDTTGKDRFTDALWARRGANGNGVVALEFPAFTCGLPSSSVIVQNLVPFSPLAAGLSAPGPNGPGQLPRPGCFDVNGKVIDADGDGLPDCWETIGGGIDFNGDGVIDIGLCVGVDTNGDGLPDAIECADPRHKDLYVEVDYFAGRKPDPEALSQTQSVDTPKPGGGTVGVTSVREAFAAAPVQNPDNTIGVRLHLQVDPEPVTFTSLSGLQTSHVTHVALTPCTDPATAAPDPSQAADFDTIKAENFGVSDAERANALALNAKRLAFRYILFADQLVGNAQNTCNGSGAAEVGGDDAVVTLGTLLNSQSQQKATFMHELGHLLGFEHGGFETVNCKPNYLSIMNYLRQWDGSPISNRRLDYSRAVLPPLNEVGGLDEFLALGAGTPSFDAVLNPIPPFHSSADQTAFGPSAWSGPVAANSDRINWNRSKQGPNPTFQTNASANINQGPTSGCDGTGTQLVGHDDWSNLLYRFTAALSAAGGARTEMPREMTKADEEAFYAARDADANGVGDNQDCGGTILPDGTTTFPCTHRIDTKPSFPIPKTINLSADANLTIAIFSEKNGSQVWTATQVKLNDLTNFPLTFSVESFVTSVKVNRFGQGTCSVSDVEDPTTGRKDGIKDIRCQFPIKTPTGEAPPTGINFGIVSGYFNDPLTGEIRAFSARQEVTILP
jgi:hypothetical protein